MSVGIAYSSRSMLLIVNPAAASGATLRNLARARREFATHDLTFAEHVTSGPGDATLATRRALGSGETRIVAVGGDGTLNEVVTGYFNLEGHAVNPEAAIGLIPSGTGSDFSRTLGFRSLHAAVAALARDRVKRLDVARIRMRDPRGVAVSRYLMNAASFGFGGDTVARVNSWRNVLPSWVNGESRFVIAALGALKDYRHRPVRLLLDGNRELKVMSALIVVANGRYAGSGMKLAPLAELDDGLLDLLVTDQVSRAGIVRELTRVWDGSHLRNPRVMSLKARSVEISAEPEMLIELDGESAGSTPAAIEVLPGSLQFIV
ncbi:MAG: diacylglycerol kinase family protein [Acidobacteriota bacterium]